MLKRFECNPTTMGQSFEAVRIFGWLLSDGSDVYNSIKNCLKLSSSKTQRHASIFFPLETFIFVQMRYLVSFSKLQNAAAAIC